MANSVFHNWAHNVTGPRGGGTSQGNVYFDQDTRTIYSYGRHFPMARFTQNEAGETCVLVTTRSYSVTTARHLQETRCSIPSSVPTFGVQYVMDACKETLQEEFAKRVEEAKALFVKAKRSRKYAESYIEDAKRILRNAKQFSEFFSLGLTAPPAFDEAEVAGIIARQKDAAKKAREEEARRLQLQKEEDAEDFAAWIRGEKHAYFPASYRDRSAYLRTVGEEVQTSQHASVPLAHAIRAYRFVKLCRMAEREYHRNGHSVRVGHFVLESVTKEGNVQVGCHYFTWERLNDWAIRQGIAEVPASDEALTVTADA